MDNSTPEGPSGAPDQPKQKSGLSPLAYERLDGRTYEPYIPVNSIMAEFTISACVLGGIFGVIFGAANAYLGLKVGLTISTSVPIAVITVAVYKAIEKLIRKKATILEANIAKTAGSASSSLASGIIFTIPALYLWGQGAQLLQVTALALCGGTLGVLFMIPLRRYLIVEEHGNLPYPEGTAGAEVLVAAEEGGSAAKQVFYGMGFAALFKLGMAAFKLWKDEIEIKVPLLKKGVIGVDLTPALLGVGYILGYRVAAIMVAGGLLAWLGIIPLIAFLGESISIPVFPETAKTIAEMDAHELWNGYIRYVGAGAVASAGIITLIRSIPTMVRSFRIALKQLKAGARRVADHLPRTDRDLSLLWVVLGALVVVIILGLTPDVFGGELPLAGKWLAAVLVAVFAFFFVTVSSRIVGLVGVTSNPTSGMIIATLIGTSSIFLVLGWTGIEGKIAALTIGTVVGIAASVAGDTSQDLKSGYLLGATPWRQQVAEILGVAATAGVIAWTVMVLAQTYGFEYSAATPTPLAAPQANMMKLVIDGVLDQSIPWGLVLFGVVITIFCEVVKIPSLPFAVGVYLPLSAMSPVYIGGVIRNVIEKRCHGDEEKIQERRERGILFGSGMVGGDGIIGVAIAAYALYTKKKPGGFGSAWAGGDVGQTLLALAPYVLLILLLIRATRLSKKA